MAIRYIRDFYGGDYVVAKPDDMFRVKGELYVLANLEKNIQGIKKCIFTISDDSKLSSKNLIVRLHNTLRRKKGIADNNSVIARPIQNTEYETFYKDNFDVLLYSFIKLNGTDINKFCLDHVKEQIDVGGDIQRVILVSKKGRVNGNLFSTYNLFKKESSEMQIDTRTNEVRDFENSVLKYLMKQRIKAIDEPKLIAVTPDVRNRKDFVHCLDNVIYEENLGRKTYHKNFSEMISLRVFPY